MTFNGTYLSGQMYICTIELGIQNKNISNSVKHVLFFQTVFQ